MPSDGFTGASRELQPAKILKSLARSQSPDGLPGKRADPGSEATTQPNAIPVYEYRPTIATEVHVYDYGPNPAARRSAPSVKPPTDAQRALWGRGTTGPGDLPSAGRAFRRPYGSPR